MIDKQCLLSNDCAALFGITIQHLCAHVSLFRDANKFVVKNVGGVTMSD